MTAKKESQQIFIQIDDEVLKDDLKYLLQQEKLLEKELANPQIPGNFTEYESAVKNTLNWTRQQINQIRWGNVSDNSIFIKTVIDR